MPIHHRHDQGDGSDLQERGLRGRIFLGRGGGRQLRAAVVSNCEISVEDRETPVPEADRLLVRVAAAGVNRADLLQRAGGYPAPHGWPSDIPGLEFAGVIEDVGPDVASLKVGDSVMGIVGGGAHATHLVTPESLCCRVPSNVDLVSAGAIPEAFITAHDALAQRAHLRPRERVLIHGVGSGVGTAAIQVASVMGARTVGTSRTSNKLDRAIELGLDEAIEASGDLADKIGQVDVVLDLIGGEYLDLNVRVTKPRGRILIVGLIAGGSALLDMGAVLSKRLVIEGTILRSRPNYEKALATRAFEREILPLVANGRIRPVVHARFQLDQIGEAYDLLNSNETFGKVLIVPG